MQDETGAVIYGTDFSAERCDEIMFSFCLERLRLVPGALPSFSNYRKFEEMGLVETALFRKKWFDYRFLHPVAATYYYAHIYQAQYRLAFRRHVSHERAEYIRLLKADDLFSNAPRLVAALWKGRQLADAFGAPYEFVIEAALRETLRFWRQRYLPRPEQIYAERACEAVAREWTEAQQHRMFHAEHYLYRAPHYAGTRDQDEHRNFLIDAALTRSDPARMLVGLVDKELLTLDWIAARTGQDLARRVEEAA